MITEYTFVILQGNCLLCCHVLLQIMFKQRRWRICPKDYVVHEVKPWASNVEPYCRWCVEFRREDWESLPPPGPELKRCYKQVTKYKPFNATICGRRYTTIYSMIVIYNVICACETALNFAETTPTTHIWQKTFEK